MRKILFTTIGLLLLACSFLTPSQANSETLLVGRHPKQWMSDFGVFTVINDILPIEGEFAHPTAYIINDYTEEDRQLIKESGRITSYGLEWIERSCSVAKTSPIISGTVMVILYKSISGAQSGYDFYNQSNKNSTIFQSEKSVRLNTSNTGTISLFQYSTCDVTAYHTEIMFQRNNVLGIIDVETLQKNSEDYVQEMLLNLGAQLDHLIQNEMNTHPGSESELVKVSNSAETIVLPPYTSPSQSPADLGNPADFIEGDLYCDGTSGFYEIGGVLTNTSDYTINIMVEWGASPASNVSYTSSTRRSDTILLLGDETRIITLYGAPFIEDNEGIPYYGCEIFFQSTNWSN